MVELPLIVTREDGARWFAHRDLLTSGRLWAERDADLRADTQRLARELPDNLFGRPVWESLEPSTRTFVASAEAVFRARRDDPAFDFSGPAIEYAKAVETELNAQVGRNRGKVSTERVAGPRGARREEEGIAELFRRRATPRIGAPRLSNATATSVAVHPIFPRLRKRLERTAQKDREVIADGRRLDLGARVPHQSLGVIVHLLERDATVARALGSVFSAADAGWLRSGAPLELRGLLDLCNPAAHSESIGRERAERVRSQVIGIACEGVLVRVARVKGGRGERA